MADETSPPETELNADAGLDEDRLMALAPFETFANPVLGQSYRLLERGTDGDGPFLRSAARFRADSVHFDEHIHEHQDETWMVRSGTLIVTIDGAERHLDSGDRITVPRGTPHRQRSPAGTETDVLHEIRPPGDTAALLRSLAAVARDGRTDAEGIPPLLHAAVIFDTYPGTYRTGLPIGVQKWLFNVLAAIGRRRGYRADPPNGPHR